MAWLPFEALLRLQDALVFERPHNAGKSMMNKAGQADPVLSIRVIGKSSLVLVNHSRIKYASISLLQRFSGRRRANGTSPAVLKEMLLQATIRMGMKCYLGQTVRPMRSAVLEAFVAMKSNASGCTDEQEST